MFQIDDETGLYYYNARYYDPELSRFVQADSVLPSLSSQGLNRYSYCANNPLKYTDPSGNVFGIDDLLIAAAVGAMIGAAVGSASAAVTGGNLVQGAMYGTIGGAIISYYTSHYSSRHCSNISGKLHNRAKSGATKRQ